jgi:hypothetical protein
MLCVCILSLQLYSDVVDCLNAAWRATECKMKSSSDLFITNKMIWAIWMNIDIMGPPLWSSGQSSWLQNGDIRVLCSLWGTNWIYICYVEESRPPLWSSGQSSWLQIQRSGFDSRCYHIFWEVVGLEQGPLSFVNTIEELLERKSSGSGLECREYGRRDSSRWPRGIIYP